MNRKFLAACAAVLLWAGFGAGAAHAQSQTTTLLNPNNNRPQAWFSDGNGHGTVSIVNPSTSPVIVVPSPYSYTPLGYQQITSVATATSLTPPAGATVAVIYVETAAVRFRDDGTAPTATVGQPVDISSTVTYSGSLSAIQFIQQASGAVLDVSYYK